jgi:hypothetical protein
MRHAKKQERVPLQRGKKTNNRNCKSDQMSYLIEKDLKVNIRNTFTKPKEIKIKVSKGK